MIDSRQDEVVEQAFFGWSDATEKVDLLAHSFRSAPDAARWLKRLEAHLRLQPLRGVHPPGQALSYLNFADGYVAVLRRVDVGHSTGRNNSHALISTASALDVPTALGLGSWDGWLDTVPNRWMGTITAKYLASAADATDLRVRVELRERELSAVLTRLLDDPYAPLSIIGCPDDDRLAMVWGLRAAADNHLRSQFRRSRLWSFSTYEYRHDDSVDDLPEIVFLPARPGGAAEAHRTIVELNGTPSVNQIGVVAGQLVAALLRGTPAPVVVAPQVTEEIPRGMPAAPDPAFRTQGAPADVRPQGGQWSSSRPSGQPKFNPAEILLNARAVPELDHELQQLAAQNSQFRAALRDKLDVNAVDSLTETIEVGTQQEFLARLMRAMYGPQLEDLRDPKVLDHAASLVSKGKSDTFAVILAAAAGAWHPDRVNKAAYARIRAGGRMPKLVPSGHALRVARRGRWLPAVASGAAVAALGAMFLVGRYTAPSQPIVVAAAGGTVAATTISQTPTTTKNIAPLPAGLPHGGQVNVPDPKGTPYAFAKVGTKYFPQAPCVQVDLVSPEWRCALFRDQGPGAALVAFVVPHGDLDKVSLKASTAEPWGDPPATWGAEIPMQP